MTFIKICGITTLEDALFVAQAGADALGFNFYPPSPRYLTPEAAWRIIARLPASIQKFGVFVNETTPQSVMSIVKQAGVTTVQLHGDESPEFCAECAALPVIKNLAVGPQFEVDSVLSYNVDGIMLDASHSTLRGGTGCRVDWEVARRVRDITPRLFLAGGLSPDNVSEAIQKVRPYAVDVCSGVEGSPGRKIPDLVHRFIENVRKIDAELMD